MAITKENREKLISAGFDAREMSYSPYSHFRVGAALLSEDGVIIKGANIEYASYGPTICAERTAIVKAVTNGKRKFTGIVVTGDLPEPISPCGICRQVLREFCPLDMPVLMVPADYDPTSPEGVDGKGVIKEMTLEELLPMSFGPGEIDKNPRKGGVN